MKYQGIFLGIFVLLIVSLIISCISNVKAPNNANNENSLQGRCIAFKGNWLEKFNECEYISEAQCRLLEGDFNECASACRHDSKAKVCIMMCVPVCSFN